MRSILEFDVLGPTPIGPITLEQHWWNEYERRAAANRRPHCVNCGRFVRKDTVRQAAGTYWDTSNDRPPVGMCVKHGRAEVTWERS